MQTHLLHRDLCSFDPCLSLGRRLPPVLQLASARTASSEPRIRSQEAARVKMHALLDSIAQRGPCPLRTIALLCQWQLMLLQAVLSDETYWLSLLLSHWERSLHGLLRLAVRTPSQSQTYELCLLP